MTEQHLRPPAFGRLGLLGALLFAVAPHLLRMPVWFSLFCLAVFGWRLLHELRGYDLPGRLIRVVLVLGGVSLVFVQYRTVIGLEAGTALLALMLCLKLLELRNMRDAIFALSIGYFLVAGGFLFSQSIFMGGYLFLVVLVLTTALIALNHPHSAMAHSRFYLTTGGKILLQAVPLMLVMFVLFPRLSSPLWGMPEQKPSGTTGLSDSIEMGSISHLADSQEVAFRVDFDGPIPAANTLYWRGPVLWQTDGKRWERLRSPIVRSITKSFHDGAEISYTITLEPHNQHWIFALDLPLSLPEVENMPIGASEDFQLFSQRPITQKLQYRVRSSTNYAMRNISAWMYDAATQLPRTANPATQELARGWQSEGLNNMAIVQRALAMFNQQDFYYTRNPPVLGDDPVDEFLFNTHRGFCEHYATAFVTLMRAAGIPARVVTGYQGGELNTLGNYLIVRQSSAHAWAEVWLGKAGWIRVDPTAAVPRDHIEADEDAVRFQTTERTVSRDKSLVFLRDAFRRMGYMWDALNHQWNWWVLGFDQKRQQELLEELGLGDFDWQWIIGIMTGLIISLVGLIGAISMLRHPRQRDPLLRLYQQFCARLERVGLVRRASEGPYDFARRVIAQRPDLATAVVGINKLYVRLRYTSKTSAENLEHLKRLIRSFRPRSLR